MSSLERTVGLLAGRKYKKRKIENVAKQRRMLQFTYLLALLTNQNHLKIMETNDKIRT